MDIIKQLQDNIKRFDALSHDVQLKAAKIGKCNFRWLNEDGMWNGCSGETFYDHVVYGLHSNYAEKPSIKECRVEGGSYIWEHENRTESSDRLSHAINDSRFVGFKYEDGETTSITRRYKYRTTGEIFDALNREDDVTDYEIITPTHALFEVKS